MRTWPPGRRPSVSRRMLNMHFCGSPVLVISCQTAWIGPRMKALKTALSLPAMDSLLRFNAVLDLGQPAGPQRAVFRGPAVVDDLDRDAVEVQLAVAPFFLRDEQPGVHQDAQVLHDGDAAHGEERRHVLDAAARPVLHDVEDLAPGRTGQCQE